MKLNLGAIKCFIRNGHEISDCDKDTIYNIKTIPECGVTTKCKYCGQEVSITIDKEDPEYYWITESET